MKIIVYSRSDDPYSDMVKNLLKYHRIDFDNIDVSRDPEAFKQLMKDSGQTKTPVLMVDGKAYVGFDHAMIKNILGIPQNQTQ
jgi:glutaredoxin